MIYSNSKRVSLERMFAEIINLKDRIQDYQERCHSLTNALARAVAAHDGTNTEISTAATPINKKKAIPNSRRGSSLKKGGQPGHEKHGKD